MRVFFLLCGFSLLLSSSILAGSYQTQCINILKQNLYDLSFGSRLALCEKASSEEGILALKIVAGSKKMISDTALETLLNVRNPYATRCIHAWTSNLYDVSFGQRIFQCGQATKSEGVFALEVAASTKIALGDNSAAQLLDCNSPYCVECLQAFKSSLYDLSYGKRIELCTQASCREGITDLRAVTSSHASIEDDALARLLTSRCP